MGTPVRAGVPESAHDGTDSHGTHCDAIWTSMKGKSTMVHVRMGAETSVNSLFEG